MANDERNLEPECRRLSVVWSPVSSFGFRHSIGFRHLSFGFGDYCSWACALRDSKTCGESTPPTARFNFDRDRHFHFVALKFDLQFISRFGFSDETPEGRVILNLMAVDFTHDVAHLQAGLESGRIFLHSLQLAAVGMLHTAHTKPRPLRSFVAPAFPFDQPVPAIAKGRDRHVKVFRGGITDPTVDADDFAKHVEERPA